ncbi:MAG TPA: STAS domain-containing protein [Acidimicrobiales bacterium]
MNDVLAVRVTRANRVVVVDVTGELDAGTAPVMVDAISSAARLEDRVVVVDTTALEFVDSGGRRALDRACRRVNAILIAGCVIHRFDALLARAA